MLSKLWSWIRAGLKTISSLSENFVGKDALKKFNEYSDEIVETINKALNIPSMESAAEEYFDDYNDFVTEAGQTVSSYNKWQVAKSRYDSTSSYVNYYTRKLQEAKRARNSNNIERYSKLLKRSETSLYRRARIMNSKWNTFTTNAKEAGELFIPLWNGYEKLKSGF